MAEFAAYLTKDEKELLSLIEYHRKHYRETEKAQGGLHPDDYEILKHFDHAEGFVKLIVSDRKQREETRNKLKEQLKWTEETETILKANEQNFSKLPDKIKQDASMLKEKLKEFKDACEAEEKAYQGLLKAEEERTRIVQQYRDYFLSAKLQDRFGNFPIGES